MRVSFLSELGQLKGVSSLIRRYMIIPHDQRSHLWLKLPLNVSGAMKIGYERLEERERIIDYCSGKFGGSVFFLGVDTGAEVNNFEEA